MAMEEAGEKQIDLDEFSRHSTDMRTLNQDNMLSRVSSQTSAKQDVPESARSRDLESFPEGTNSQTNINQTNSGVLAESRV